MDRSNLNNKGGLYLPTVLKDPLTVSADIEIDGVGDETPCYYNALNKNKRHLIKDRATVPGRHLNVFSENKESSELKTVGEIFEARRMVPGVRMPNTERQPDPPPSYRQGPGGNRRQGSWFQSRRQRQQGQVYVYIPEERPMNTRDFGAYREGRQNPHHRLVDRQRSDGYLFDKQLRKAFVCKVYIILSMLLALSFGCCLITTFVTPVKLFFIKFWWIAFIFLLIYLVLIICLMCVSSLRRKYPLNLFLLVLLCVSMTVPLCVTTAVYTTKTVLLSLGTVVLITCSISFLAKVLPWDVTGCGMLVCILGLVFSLYAMITFIVSLFIYEPLLHLILGAIGTLLFSFFLFFDTQQILGGRRVEISHEEYILGVILLYVDIIMIFLMLLNIYGYSE